MSLFALDGKPSNKPENDVDDIPREELLSLCMKLNKRMQLMEGKSQELTKRYKVVVHDRALLIDLIKASVTVPITTSENDAIDIDALKDIWLHHLNEQQLHIHQLEEDLNRFRAIVNKTGSSVIASSDTPTSSLELGQSNDGNDSADYQVIHVSTCVYIRYKYSYKCDI